VLWLSTWKMIGFVLNGFVFVMIGLQAARGGGPA
jgi:NhaP-type Na+/H+ or K+/H+ antiporter